MSTKRIQAALTCAAVAILGASIARADAPCNAGYRDSTPAERARMTAILEIAKKSLPPAPAGWQIASDDGIYVLTSLCRDYERVPFSYDFSRTYRRVDYDATHKKPMEDAFAYAAAEQQKKQPRLDAIVARMTELTELWVALSQKRDYAGLEKTDAEMARLKDELKKVQDEGDSKARIAAAGKIANADNQLHISVQINPRFVSQVEGARNFPLPADAFAAIRWDWVGDPPTPDEAHVRVLVGNWKHTQNVRWTPVQRPNAPLAAAHSISVAVRGDAKRVDSNLPAIDFKSLATALTK